MTIVDPQTAEMLRETVAKHCERHADGATIRSSRGEVPGAVAVDVGTLAELGWLAISVPESSGGLGLGIAAAGIVTEGLAGCYTSDPFVGLFLGARALVHARAFEDLLALLAEGSATPVLAWQENDVDFASPSPGTVYHEGKVTGTKRWVVSAAEASHFIISAREDGEDILVLVEASSTGIHLTHTQRADGTPVGRLTLVSVPCEVIARGSEAQRVLRRTLDEGTVLVAAELMGHVDRMMALVLDHLKTRKQFGKVIGSFQALQHRASSMFVHQRLARSVLTMTLAEADQISDPLEFGQRAARLRARLNDTTQLIMRESIQLFGAMGITDENELSLHIKRCLSLLAYLGNSTEQRRYWTTLFARLVRTGAATK